MEIVRSFNWIDVLVIILLIRACYIGTRTGLTIELQKSVGLVTGFLLSYNYYKELGQYISEHSFFGITWAQLFSLVVVMMILQLAIKFLTMLLSKIVKLQFAPRVEKVGGGILGCLRGIFLASVALVLLGMLPSSYLQDSITGRSLSGIYINKVSIGLYNLLVKFFPVG